MMKIKQLALAVCSATLSSTVLAHGFALTEQSISAMGTANASRASHVENANVVYNNPAAMGELKGKHLSAGTSLILASSNISNAASPFPGTNAGDIVPTSFVPSGYFTTGDRGGLAYGLAAYGSFGLKTNHEDTFQGRHLGDKSSVKVTTLQPTISLKVHDKLNVGVGATINKLEAYLSKNLTSVPVAGPGSAGSLGNVELEGDDLGYGYVIGLHSNLNEDTKAGFVYRSKVKYKIDDGTLNYAGNPALAPGLYAASTGLTLPESAELSISHAISARNTLHAGASWMRWSRFKQLDVTSSSPNPAFANSTEVFNWKDSDAFSVGLTHKCDNGLLLRAGLAYDNSPIQPADRSVRLPSADRRIASVGASYTIADGHSIDLSYSYLDEERAEVRQATYSADFNNSAHIVGAQYNLSF